jgi:lysophospholipase L1-like esterase
MRKKYLLIIVPLIIVLVGLYLNRSYSHIYKKIDQAALKSPETQQIYNLGYGINPENITYVAMGDSLTSGVGVDNYEKSYPFLIAKKIAAAGNEVVLKNRSFTGAITENLNNSFTAVTIEDKPDIITLFIGINDIHGHVSKEDFKNNYKRILDLLTQETQAKIYVIGLPAIGSPDLLLWPYNLYFDFRTREFNEVIKEVAESYKVKYIDLYSPTIEEYKRVGEHYSTDSFHPSEKGYAEWAEIIYDDFN